MIETRIFNADVGDDSVGNAGPDAIEQDLDNLYENKAWKKDVLTKSNTIDYIPTHDYHPATKKYIDTKATETLQAVDGLVDLLNERIDNRYTIGTYIGTEELSEEIVLNFEPSMVIIQNSSSPISYTIIRGYDCKNNATILGQITETGFTVSDVLNTDTTTYNYIAFK